MLLFLPFFLRFFSMIRLQRERQRESRVAGWSWFGLGMSAFVVVYDKQGIPYVRDG